MSTEATLARPHVWRPGTGGPPLLMLHGTGADEHDLLPLATALSPGSGVLAPRGTVLEDGRYNRFFRRSSAGVFDEDDIRERVAGLAAFVGAAGEAHDVPAGHWVAVGFSNGSSTAAALLLGYPQLLAGAVLFAGMPPFAEPPAVDLTGRWVLIANGVRDPLATPAKTALLERQFRDRGAEVIVLPHRGGHTIDARRLPEVAAALAAHA